MVYKANFCSFQMQDIFPLESPFVMPCMPIPTFCEKTFRSPLFSFRLVSVEMGPWWFFLAFNVWVPASLARILIPLMWEKKVRTLASQQGYVVYEKEIFRSDRNSFLCVFSRGKRFMWSWNRQVTRIINEGQLQLMHPLIIVIKKLFKILEGINYHFVR